MELRHDPNSLCPTFVDDCRGYSGGLVGEAISETYETELETLAAWMGQTDTRRIIMSPDARNLGFSWHQESGGKIWWTLVMGN